MKVYTRVPIRSYAAGDDEMGEGVWTGWVLVGLVLAATWRCDGETLQWIGHPDLSQCVSQHVSDLTQAYRRFFDTVRHRGFTTINCVKRCNSVHICAVPPTRDINCGNCLAFSFITGVSRNSVYQHSLPAGLAIIISPIQYMALDS